MNLPRNGIRHGGDVTPKHTHHDGDNITIIPERRTSRAYTLDRLKRPPRGGAQCRRSQRCASRRAVVSTECFNLLDKLPCLFYCRFCFWCSVPFYVNEGGDERDLEPDLFTLRTVGVLALIIAMSSYTTCLQL